MKNEQSAEYWGNLLKAASCLDVYINAVKQVTQQMDADVDALADIKAQAFLGCCQAIGRFDLQTTEGRIDAARWVADLVRKWFDDNSACDRVVEGPYGKCELNHLSPETWNNLSKDNILRAF